MKKTVQTTWGFARTAALWAAACMAALVLSSLVFAVPAEAGETEADFVDHGTKFVFVTASEESETDLFENFKDLMPGDKVLQTIVVENHDPDGLAGEIYLSVRPTAEGMAGEGSTVSMEDFLSQLHLTVKQGNKTLFSGAPSTAGDLAEPVLLGALSKGESLELAAYLTVPADLGNEYSFCRGTVDWIFRLVEYDPDNDDDDNGEGSAETGDTMGRMLLVGAGLVLVGGMVAVIARRKSRE